MNILSGVMPLNGTSYKTLSQLISNLDLKGVVKKVVFYVPAGSILEAQTKAQNTSCFSADGTGIILMDATLATETQIVTIDLYSNFNDSLNAGVYIAFKPSRDTGYIVYF